MKKSKQENDKVLKLLEIKIEKLDKEVELINDKKKQRIFKSEQSGESLNPITCKLSDKTSNKFIDLENHIQTCHTEQNVFV